MHFFCVGSDRHGLAAYDGARETTVGKAAMAATAGSVCKTIVPLVAKYCGDCHAGEKAEAKLDLVHHKDGMLAALHDRKVCCKVMNKRARTRCRRADGEQPSEAQGDTIVRWIDNELAKPVPYAAQDPGRVTIRRLNRAEYNNTIRDLIGVDFKPADDFPTDDVGYGFDNIGDVLSLSPLLFEKYLAAAERILDEAIIVPSPGATPPTKTFEVGKLSFTGPPGIARNGTRRLIKNGDLFTDWTVRRPGEYKLQVRASPRNAGTEAPRMVIKLDGKELKAFDVRSPRGFGALYDATAKLSIGQHRLAVGFTNEFHDPGETDPRRQDRALLVNIVQVVGPLAPNDPATFPETHQRIFFCRPDGDNPSASERADCAKKIITRFASRAYRRPATENELTRLMKFFDDADKDGQPLEGAVKAALTAVLVSPRFLFRVEIDAQPDNAQANNQSGNSQTGGKAEPAAAAKHSISDYELASRLSYFLWSSMPDDELFRLCLRGELRKGDKLKQQVRRMLKDPKAQALVDNFASQWLQTRRLAIVTPDRNEFPDFDEELRTAMRRETELFFSHVMSEDRSVLDFLSADYTWANERLARHYGISGVSGDDFRRVSLAGTHRGGVMTQAAVLTLTSNPARTSPVKRGKWVLETLLGTPPPPPPMAVPALPEGKQAALTGTVRQRLEQHRADPICAACHKVMDPLGFALENFDPVGNWRTTDGNFPIDAKGTLPGGKTFDGIDGLREILLARKDQFCRCLAEKMLTYALGRGLEDYDDAAVDQIAHACASANYRFSSLMIAVVESAPFQQRRGK